MRQYLEELMAKRELPPGALLPSEAELQAQLGLSRGTIRRALDDLQREGRVVREPGRGTFVAQPRLERPLPELTSFTEHLVSLGFTPGARLVSYRTSRCYREVADVFPAGTAVARIERVRTANGVPVGIHVLYLPDDLAHRIGFTATALRRSPGTSLYGAFESSGIEIDVAREALISRLATDEEATLLRAGASRAILEMRRQTFDAEGRTLELVRAAYLGDRYEYAIWLRRPQGDSLKGALDAP